MTLFPNKVAQMLGVRTSTFFFFLRCSPIHNTWVNLICVLLCESRTKEYLPSSMKMEWVNSYPSMVPNKHSKRQLLRLLCPAHYEFSQVETTSYSFFFLIPQCWTQSLCSQFLPAEWAAATWRATLRSKGWFWTSLFPSKKIYWGND